jgi:hypothetical protein
MLFIRLLKNPKNIAIKIDNLTKYKYIENPINCIEYQEPPTIEVLTIPIVQKYGDYFDELQYDYLNLPIDSEDTNKVIDMINYKPPSNKTVKKYIILIKY